MAVNAPEAGTIKEFLVNEEDTVTVGQDLVRLELGGAPSGDKEAPKKEEAPKEASKEEPKKSEAESKPAPKQESSPAPKKDAQPSASKPEPPRQPEKKETKAESSSSATGGLGNREERRVRFIHTTQEYTR